MGIDEKTLRKHFSRELEYGMVLVDGLILDVLLRRTREGHAPSIRQLRERLVEGKREITEREMGSAPRPEAQEKLGKKVIDERRAHAADADLMEELEREAAEHARH